MLNILAHIQHSWVASMNILINPDILIEAIKLILKGKRSRRLRIGCDNAELHTDKPIAKGSPELKAVKFQDRIVVEEKYS